MKDGKKPRGEYAVLREGHFSKVIAMVDTALAPSSFGSMSRFALQALQQTWGFDNTQLFEEFPGIQYLAMRALARRPGRVAMLIHNVKSLKRRLPLGTLRLGQCLAHVQCLSEQSRRELERVYGIEPRRITVVGSRVDTSFFRPNPAVAVAQQVCSAGAVNRDYDLLIEAMRPLGIPTRIAADTEWRYSVKSPSSSSVRRDALPASVEMHSWGTYLKLRDLYAQSAVVVVPLGMPVLSGVTVALEGMAMGKPVILTRNPYVEDFLIDGETGYFVPPGSAEAIRDRVRRLLDNPGLSERVGSRAREWVCDRFTVQHYVDRIMSVWS